MEARAEFLAAMPEEMRRLLEDGISTFYGNLDDPDERVFADFVDWDTIAALTPEEREYYGLTAIYEFVMNLPEDQRPIPLSSRHE